MKRLLLIGTMLAIVGAFAPSHADCYSPQNGAGSCETADNHVQCGPGTQTPVGVVSASADGAELCNAGDTLPLKGRVGAQHACDCVYIDGTEDNPHGALPLNGWARVDSTGVHCAQRGQPDNQSYNQTDGTDIRGCAGV